MYLYHIVENIVGLKLPAEKLLLLLRQQWPSSEGRLGVRAGLSCLATAAEAATEALKQAARALQYLRQYGRDTLVIYSLKPQQNSVAQSVACCSSNPRVSGSSLGGDSFKTC